MVTVESVKPALYAIAFMVSVVATLMGAEYIVPTVSVGVLPSVVYRIDAPDVVELIVTVWMLVYVPAVGLKVKEATCCDVVAGDVVLGDVVLGDVVFGAVASGDVQFISERFMKPMNNTESGNFVLVDISCL